MPVIQANTTNHHKLHQPFNDNVIQDQSVASHCDAANALSLDHTKNNVEKCLKKPGLAKKSIWKKRLSEAAFIIGVLAIIAGAIASPAGWGVVTMYILYAVGGTIGISGLALRILIYFQSYDTQQDYGQNNKAFKKLKLTDKLKTTVRNWIDANQAELRRQRLVSFEFDETTNLEEGMYQYALYTEKHLFCKEKVKLRLDGPLEKGVSDRKHPTYFHSKNFNAKKYRNQGIPSHIIPKGAGEMIVDEEKNCCVNRSSGHMEPTDKDFDIYAPVVKNILTNNDSVAKVKLDNTTPFNSRHLRTK